MKEQLAISAAIIGASIVAAVVIAGGPSGIFPTDDAGSLTITTDALFDPPPEATTPVATTVSSSTPDVVATTEPEQTAPERTTTVPDRTTTVPDRTTTVPGTTEPGTTAPASSQTTVTPSTAPDDGLVARKDLAVAVANGSGLPGVAATKAEQLAALGYVDPTPENASSFPYTLVLFPPGMEGEASRLAKDAGLLATSTLAMDKSPDIGVPKTYDLVLVLGTDQRPPSG